MKNQIDTSLSIQDKDLSYLRNMIADNAFQKMTDQYRLLKSLISPFFLLFMDFDNNQDEMKRITDDCYNYSQMMLKVLDDFDDRFYPIIELAEVRLSEPKREIKQNV